MQPARLSGMHLEVTMDNTLINIGIDVHTGFSRHRASAVHVYWRLHLLSTDASGDDHTITALNTPPEPGSGQRKRLNEATPLAVVVKCNSFLPSSVRWKR